MLKSLRELHWSIYALALANGVVMTGFMMLLPLLPGYSENLGFDEFDIGLLVAAFFAGRVLFQFPMGVLSDRIGRRGIITASLSIFTVSTGAYALTTTVWLMMLLRMFQGVSASSLAVGSQSYINDRTPAGFRGLANGITSSAINIGVILGPMLAGLLSQNFSIRTPFWVGAALGAACFVISLAIPAVPGAVSSSLATSSNSAESLFRKVLSSVFCLPSFSLSLIQFLSMMSIAIFLTSAPLLTSEILRWSSSEIALAFAAGGAAAAVSSPFLGQLSDRIGRISVIALGMASLALEALVVFMHPGTPLTIAAFAVGGAGTPAYFNAFYSLIGDVTIPVERGAVTGFVGSFGEWGSIIGSSIIVPVVWSNVSVSAPMGLNFLICVITLVLTLVMRAPLQRQVGRIASPGSSRFI